MIPVRDVIPSRTVPGVTLTIIGLNTAAYLYGLTLGPRVDVWLADLSLIPAQLSPLTVVTSMFLHGGLLSLAGNMLYLWLFGDNIEDRMGHGRFAVFYLLCGIGAALVHTLMHPRSFAPVVGASGAVGGVLGAYFVLYPRSKIVTLLPLFLIVHLVEVPAVFFLALWFLLQFVNGLEMMAPGSAARAASNAAFWAQVAGFVLGAAGVMVLRRPERFRVEWWDDA